MILKIHYGSEVHLLKNADNFQDVNRFVETAFRQKLDNYSLTYLDGDGDQITISSQNDLNILKQSMNTTSFVKVNVHRIISSGEESEKKRQQPLKEGQTELGHSDQKETEKQEKPTEDNTKQKGQEHSQDQTPSQKQSHNQSQDQNQQQSYSSTPSDQNQNDEQSLEEQKGCDYQQTQKGKKKGEQSTRADYDIFKQKENKQEIVVDNGPFDSNNPGMSFAVGKNNKIDKDKNAELCQKAHQHLKKCISPLKKELMIPFQEKDKKQKGPNKNEKQDKKQELDLKDMQKINKEEEKEKLKNQKKNNRREAKKLLKAKGQLQNQKDPKVQKQSHKLKQKHDQKQQQNKWKKIRKNYIKDQFQCSQIPSNINIHELAKMVKKLLNLEKIEQSSQVHKAECNICQIETIKGIRYKCTKCPDYNLCSLCEDNYRHEHDLIKIRKANQQPSFQPLNKNKIWREKISQNQEEKKQQSKTLKYKQKQPDPKVIKEIIRHVKEVIGDQKEIEEFVHKNHEMGADKIINMWYEKLEKS